MKTILSPHIRSREGYALLMVMVIAAASLLILEGTLNRTYTVAKLNDRSNQYNYTLNAAQAAVEKTFARMSYDFSTPGQGLATVSNNAASGFYATNLPNESTFWQNFTFSDAQGHDGKIYVTYLSNYTGLLPSQFTDAAGNPEATLAAPVYRIVANARLKSGAVLTTACQEDVLLALVPISNTALFSSTNMEFTWCAPFTVTGPVKANANIYTGTSSSSYLTFNSVVTSVGTVSSPALSGYSTTDYKGPITFNDGYTTNVPTTALSINMTNTHSLIDMPASSSEITTNLAQAEQRLYNQAQVVLLVSNSTVTAIIQNGTLPGQDTSPKIITSSTNAAALATNFPFLSLSNTFTDQREGKIILVSQIDLGKYSSWLTASTNAAIQAKFPSGGANYPDILYVADERSYTAGSQLTAIRLTNNTVLPQNGGLGFSLATPNPLYVWGNYNCTNSAYLGTTNTTATVPSALFSDAVTVLSPSWSDLLSSGLLATRVASNTTINAAMLAGMVYTTGTSSSTFSGGIMNYTRLLESWSNSSGGSQKTLTLNTSIISLFASKMATTQFQSPGNYYYAPSRNFNYDYNFYNPAKQPPGMPCALMPVRFNFAEPPANTVTYNVTP